jgi:hypothetical protein
MLAGLRLIDNVSDSVHAELSRANLLRMRGDYPEAQNQCLSILKRYPHHFETHLLLADVYADEQQFESAAQWYELAIDLDPGSFVARQRFQVMRDHLRQLEIADTAQQLGLPPGSSKRTALVAGMVVGLIVVAAIIAYGLGQHNSAPAGSDVVRSPVRATSESVLEPEPTVVDLPPPEVKPEPTVLPALTAEDRVTTNALKLIALGDRVVAASLDPRTKNLLVTYRLQEDDTERKVGAELARESLAAIPEAPQVTVRALRGEHVIYMADVHRTRLAETQTEAWRSTATGLDAWMHYVLQNEWFASPPNSTPAAGEETPTP